MHQETRHDQLYSEYTDSVSVFAWGCTNEGDRLIHCNRNETVNFAKLFGHERCYRFLVTLVDALNEFEKFYCCGALPSELE